MKSTLILATVSLVALTGCDPISGVNTNAKLDSPADIACIDRTIRKIDGVGPVRYLADRDESFQILPYRGKVITISNEWVYEPDQSATLQVTDDGRDRNYRNGMMKMGKPFPAVKLDAFVPLMKRVNAALEHDCGLPLSANGHITRN